MTSQRESTGRTRTLDSSVLPHGWKALAAACVVVAAAAGGDGLARQGDGDFVLSGVVTNRAGEPLENVTVLAVEPGRRPGSMLGAAEPQEGRRVEQSVTGADGFFAIEATGGGPFTLFARHPRYAAATVPGASPGGRITIVLETGSSIAGRVYDAVTMRPVAGARLEAMPLGGGDFRGTFFEDVARRAAASDESGAFTIDRLEQGVYDLTAVADGYATAELENQRVLAAGTTGELSLYLERGVSLAGRVVSPDGEPVPDASLQVTPAELGPDLMRWSRRPGRGFERARARTDIDGTFAIDGLAWIPAYTIVVRHRDFATTWVDVRAEDDPARLESLRLRLRRGGVLVARLLDSNGEPYAGELELDFELEDEGALANLLPRRVRLEASELSLDAGALRATRLPAGEGTVTLRPVGRSEVRREGVRVAEGAPVDLGTLTIASDPSITGVVVDAEGQGLAGVTVNARVRGRWQPVTARTDARGRFRLGGLDSEERYTVSAAVDGFETAQVEETEAGGEPLSIVLTRLGRVTGRVLAGDPPAPVVGFRVDRYSKETGGNPTQRGRWGRRQAARPPGGGDVFGDRAGRFEIELAPGPYTLKVSAEGFVPQRLEQIDVVAGQDVELGEVLLERGVTLAGVVVDGLTGAPVPNASVSIDRTGRVARGPRWPSGEAVATTGPDGRFFLGGQWPGVMAVRVEAETHAPWSGELTIEPGVVPQPLRVELSAGGSIEGLVLDPDTGQVMAGAFVFAGGSGAGTRGGIGVTDAAGMFALEHLVPGTYTVMARPAPTGGGGRGFGAMLDGMQPATATVREGEVTFVSFPPPAGGLRVSGTLRRGSTPLPARLFWIPEETRGGPGRGFAAARAESDGRFEVTLQSGGTYDVRVIPVATESEFFFGRGSSYTVRAEIPEGGKEGLELVVGENFIAGRVSDAGSGEPLGGVTVVAHRVDDDGRPTTSGRPASTDRTADDGTYRLDGLAEGEYGLWLVRPGYALEPAGSVSIDEDEEVDGWDVLLTRAPPVAITVSDDGGVPIEGALAMPLEERALPRGLRLAALTDVDGLAELMTAPAGSFRVGIIARGYAPVLLDVPAQIESDPRLIDARLETGLPLLVRVVDGNEDPLEGVPLEIMEDRGDDLTRVVSEFLERGGASLATDERGEVRIPSLAAGRYVVRAQAEQGQAKKTFALRAGDSGEVVLELR